MNSQSSKTIALLALLVSLLAIFGMIAALALGTTKPAAATNNIAPELLAGTIYDTTSAPSAWTNVACGLSAGSCTANDAEISDFTLVPVGGDTCASADDTILVDVTYEIDSNSDRYDFGFWIGLEGTIANGASCGASILPIPPGDNIDNDNDLCGDHDNTSGPIAYNVGTIELPCTTDDTGALTVSVCASWSQDKTNTCNNIEGEDGLLAGTGSKCSCNEAVIAEVVVPTTFEVSKTPSTSEVQSDAVGDAAVVTYTIVVTNTGPFPATVDTIADAPYDISGSDCATNMPGTVLAVGDVATCTFAIDYTDEAVGDYPDTITVGYTDTNNNSSEAMGSASVSVVEVIPPAVLEVSKSPNPPAIGEDDTGADALITFTIAVTNTGPVTATVDAIADNPYNIAGSDCALNMPGTVLGVGEVATCIFVLGFEGFETGEYADTVTVDFTDDNNNSGDASGSATINVLTTLEVSTSEFFAENAPSDVLLLIAAFIVLGGSTAVLLRRFN